MIFPRPIRKLTGGITEQHRSIFTVTKVEISEQFSRVITNTQTKVLNTPPKG